MVSVCAVVLTYNREALLRRCLDAILSQSRKCDDILVVDNASTDGTISLLRNARYDGVSVCQLRRNVGAAGGFSLGIQLGYLSNSDFLWVMDDDVIAEPDALERLLEGRDLLSSRSIDPPFMISTANAPCGALTNVPEVSRTRNKLDYQNWPHLLAKGLVPVERSTFVSILLPRKTVTKFGIPLSNMFIWGEDSEYTMRISAEEPGYLSAHSRVEHVRAAPGRLNILTEQDETRVKWHSYMVRNTIYTTRRYSSPRHLYHFVGEQAGLVLKLFARGDFSRAIILAKGIAAGLIFRAGDARYDQPLPIENISYLSTKFGNKIAVQPQTERPVLSPSLEIKTA